MKLSQRSRIIRGRQIKQMIERKLNQIEEKIQTENSSNEREENSYL